jgi:hypothetical protein
MFTEGSVIGDVALSEEETIYSRHGDVFAQACTGFGLLMILGTVVGKFARRDKSR